MVLCKLYKEVNERILCKRNKRRGFYLFMLHTVEVFDTTISTEEKKTRGEKNFYVALKREMENFETGNKTIGRRLAAETTANKPKETAKKTVPKLSWCFLCLFYGIASASFPKKHLVRYYKLRVSYCKLLLMPYLYSQYCYRQLY